MCFKNTVMQVMYNYFILLEFNNTVIIPPASRNVEWHESAECPNLANSIISGSSVDEACNELLLNLNMGRHGAESGERWAVSGAESSEWRAMGGEQWMESRERSLWT